MPFEEVAREEDSVPVDKIETVDISEWRPGDLEAALRIAVVNGLTAEVIPADPNDPRSHPQFRINFGPNGPGTFWETLWGWD